MANHVRNVAATEPLLIRWPQPPEALDGILSSRELKIDFGRRLIKVRGKTVHLAPKEFDLLRRLVMSHDRPVSHTELLQAIWGPDYGAETELLRVVVNQLRKKI